MVHIKIGPLKMVYVRQKSKCPTSYHFSTDRQSTLILLFMALSSLDINKMASKNLFYINTASFFKIPRRLRKFFQNFILVKISAFDIPKFRIVSNTFESKLEFFGIYFLLSQIRTSQSEFHKCHFVV